MILGAAVSGFVGGILASLAFRRFRANRPAHKAPDPFDWREEWRNTKRLR